MFCYAMKKTFSELEKQYDLKLGKIEKTIKKEKAKTILLQFPDGMKPYSTIIADELEKRCKNAKFLIWFGSCFGACDIPKVSDIDLIVQFGHTAWNYKNSEIEVLK